MKCRICGSDRIVSRFAVREMMIPTREEFVYLECGNCRCLQIEQVPEDLGRYYGPDYYSFQVADDRADENGLEGNGAQAMGDDQNGKEALAGKDAPILDVGCGAGKFLKELHAIGYRNLTGCDPFLSGDIAYGNDIHIYKRTIHEMEGQFEKIFMNDSFEHVTDPHEVMESVHRLLSPTGMVRIAIPVFPNVAFEMFGADWYQLDAPRHIFLHSRVSMALLAKQHGLHIVDVTFDADPSQIYRSFLYAKDVPFWEQTMKMVIDDLGEAEVNEIVALTREANEKGYGDHAVFCMVREK